MTVFQTPVTLMSIVSWKTSGVVASHAAGMQMPAFATTMSRPPSSLVAFFTTAFWASRSRTSARSRIARRPSASTSRLVSARSSGVAGS